MLKTVLMGNHETEEFESCAVSDSESHMESNSTEKHEPHLWAEKKIV